MVQELLSIFLSAVLSSFITTVLIVAVIGGVYYATFKWMAAYISFDKIANQKKN